MFISDVQFGIKMLNLGLSNFINFIYAVDISSDSEIHQIIKNIINHDHVGFMLWMQWYFYIQKSFQNQDKDKGVSYHCSFSISYWKNYLEQETKITK